MTKGAPLDLLAAAKDICAHHSFEYISELGKGASKRAFLVERKGVAVALKIAVVAGSVERLTRETAALRDCSHPGVAALIDVFPHAFGGASLWVVIEEYLAGGTLEEKLQKGTLPPGEVQQLGLSLVDVLELLDARRVVHRDIKPANILFRTNGTPVLTDFGIARLLDEPTLTHAHMPLGPGTPGYAAPEQLNNEKTLIDWRTDQFGLGLVLAECLTGAHPYIPPGGTLAHAVAAVSAKQEMPISTVAVLGMMGFDCLTRALKSWPVARFRRPNDFRKALESI
jgi:eukaryotic-like serine/threonine-protein kinase